PTSSSSIIFHYNETATTQIYTLSLHDALPILARFSRSAPTPSSAVASMVSHSMVSSLVRIDPIRFQSPSNGYSSPHLIAYSRTRSEEHTSELQSRENLVCRLLLEKKKKT